MTQCERVLQYMEKYGSINPMQAMEDLCCMRLASRISDLRHDGNKISRRMVAGVNRYGEKVTYAEYRLENEK